MSSIKFRMTARCEAAGRPENEDNFQLSDNLTKGNWGFNTDKEISLGKNGALLVVCDGMGGMNAGEVASAIAVETVKTRFSEDDLGAVVSSPSGIKKYIEKVIVAADSAIKKESLADSEKEGMGSTIVLAWLMDDVVYVGWCGDSRAYRYNPADGLVQLSKDHSYVQELVDAGKLTEELAFDHPNNNIITRSLGDPNRTAKPDVREYDLRNGDIILLCSDGLSGVLRDREIAEVIAANSDTLAACRDALWEAAREAGWHDNVTIGLCQVLSGGERAVAGVGAAKPPTNKLSCKTKILIIGLVTLVVVLLGFIGYNLRIGDKIFDFFKKEPAAEQQRKDDGLLAKIDSLKQKNKDKPFYAWEIVDKHNADSYIIQLSDTDLQDSIKQVLENLLKKEEEVSHKNTEIENKQEKSNTEFAVTVTYSNDSTMIIIWVVWNKSVDISNFNIAEKVNIRGINADLILQENQDNHQFTWRKSQDEKTSKNFLTSGTTRLKVKNPQKQHSELNKIQASKDTI